LRTPTSTFYLCREHKIVIDIDGGTHNTNAEAASDAKRVDEVERLGFRVLRISNSDVFDNLDGVLDALLAFASEKDRLG
jgi:very-short-patch-repair endonuclease